MLDTVLGYRETAMNRQGVSAVSLCWLLALMFLNVVRCLIFKDKDIKADVSLVGKCSLAVFESQCKFLPCYSASWNESINGWKKRMSIFQVAMLSMLKKLQEHRMFSFTL